MCTYGTKTNRVRLSGDPLITYVDVTRTRREIETSRRAQRDVVSAGCVTRERITTVGRVVTAGCVTKERVSASSRVYRAGGVAIERNNTDGRVLKEIGRASCRERV